MVARWPYDEIVRALHAITLYRSGRPARAAAACQDAIRAAQSHGLDSPRLHALQLDVLNARCRTLGFPTCPGEVELSREGKRRVIVSAVPENPPSGRQRSVPQPTRRAAGLTATGKTMTALVHGDLIPGNILVDDDLRPLAVLGFGFLSTAADPAFDAAVTASAYDPLGQDGHYRWCVDMLSRESVVQALDAAPEDL